MLVDFCYNNNLSQLDVSNNTSQYTSNNSELNVNSDASGIYLNFIYTRYS